MIPKRLFEYFKQDFPWYVSMVVKFRANREEGGIDIFLNDGVKLNYQKDKNGFILKGGGFHGDSA